MTTLAAITYPSKFQSMLDLIETRTLTPLGLNFTRLTEKCSNQLELKFIQDMDKYADFIFTAISTAVDKAIPTSKSGRRAWKIRKRCQGSRSRAKDMAARKFHFKFLIMRNCVE